MTAKNSLLDSAQQISIKAKLIKMQLLLAFLVLFSCSTALFINDLFIFKQSVETNLESMAKVLGYNLSPTLAFADKLEAEKILSSLQSDPAITNAYVFDSAGSLFAQYAEPNSSLKLDFKKFDRRSSFIGHYLVLHYPLAQNGEAQGDLFIAADLMIVASKFVSYPITLFLVIAVSMGIAYAIALWVQGSLSGPITGLAATIRHISSSGNYGVRVEKMTDWEEIREIEALSQEFNQLLEKVQEKDRIILSANLELEKKVEQRTLELKEAHVSLVQSSKMSALGEMAAGLAHEINNPLAVIQANAGILQELVQEQGIDGPAVKQISSTIERTSERIAKIVKGLRSFSRDGTRDPFVQTPLKSIVEDTLALCAEKVRNAGIDLRVKDIPADLKCDCRPSQISQVLLNLVGNARDAISDLPEKWIEIECIDKGPSVTISVTDSGRGIPEQVLKKIFQPFFTTKEVGKGTGLGLSISRGIIEGHGGTFQVNSNCPNTQFVIELSKVQIKPAKSA